MPQLHKSSYRILIFIVGLIATIAYRLIIILNNYNNQLWVEICWYIGTLGFIWYFAHRYNIEDRRDKLIGKLQLIKKVEVSQSFNPEDKTALVYILKSLETSLAKWNYIAIFILSGLAIAYAIYTDLTTMIK